MSRHRDRRRQGRQAPPLGGVRLWTIQRASNFGILLGIAAVLVAGLLGTSGRVLYPYAALLVATAFCGATILWITAFDMRDRGTSGRMAPIRGFDFALAVILLVPSLYALSLIWPRLTS